MAQFYLINPTTVGNVRLLPGTLIDDQVVSVSTILAAGGILWPSSDPIIAAAATVAQNAHKFRGSSEFDLSTIMQSAVDKSQGPAPRGNYNARGVVFANVASLAAFTVAGNDGVTYVEGDKVLLANQTTVADCGLYVVGPVVGGVATLSRAPEMPAGMKIVNGTIIEVSEGTIYAGSTWKAMTTVTGGAVLGTNDPNFYPRVCKGTATLVAGTVTLGATQGLFVFDKTKCPVQLTRNTVGGTVTTTIMYACAVGTRVDGKSGTAALVLQAVVAAGTIQNTDTSTVDFAVINW